MFYSIQKLLFILYLTPLLRQLSHIYLYSKSKTTKRNMKVSALFQTKTLSVFQQTCRTLTWWVAEKQVLDGKWNLCNVVLVNFSYLTNYLSICSSCKQTVLSFFKRAKHENFQHITHVSVKHKRNVGASFMLNSKGCMNEQGLLSRTQMFFTITKHHKDNTTVHFVWWWLHKDLNIENHFIQQQCSLLGLLQNSLNLKSISRHFSLCKIYTSSFTV